MKRKALILAVLLTSVLPVWLRAQTECTLHLITDFDSDCLLTSYPGGHVTILEEDTDGCLLACQGNTVSYTAVCDSATSFVWSVAGALSYTITNQNKTAIVTWGNGETGTVSVTVVTPDSNTCTASVCVLLMESPQIESASIPMYYLNDGKRIEVCRNETVELSDMSSDGSTPITGYRWEIPSGEHSTPECSFTATNTGEFVIVHEVWNECGCKTIEEILLNVVEPAHLDLSCYGTACAGTTARYSLSSPDCSQYIWSVEGGTFKADMLSGNIDVHWGNPSSGSGIITLDDNFCNACNAQVSVKIPIITDNVEITGPETVCVGDIQQYELPLWGATGYLWTTSNNSGIQILNTESSNKKLVKFTQPGVYILSVRYECEVLECGPFHSTKVISVKDTLRVKSDDDNLCIGETGIYTTLHGETVSWKVFASDSQLLCSIVTDTLTYAFDHSGKHIVTASGTGYCNVAEFWVTVLENPPALTVTEGPHAACLNNTILLSATPTHPRHYIEWIPVCSPSALQSGNTVSIHYGDEICDVAVYQVDNEYGCRSTAYIHHVDTFSLHPHGLPLITDACPGDWVSFEVPDQSANVLYEWRMEPVNAATAIGDNLLHHVSIRPNHLTGIPSFSVDVILTRIYCGEKKQEDTVQISVNNLPHPVIHHPDTVCQLAGVTFWADSLPVPGNCIWNFSNSMLSGTTVSREFSTPGLHTFTVTYRPDSECDSYTDTGSVFVLPAPQVNITIHGDTLCVPVQPEVSYLWTHDEDTVGYSSCCLINGDGNYCCLVSSLNPPYCSRKNCRHIGAIQPDTCLPISFSEPVVTCNSAIFTAIVPENASFTWGTDPDFGSCFPTHSTGNTTATFNTVGNRYVDAYAEVNGQCYKGRKYVTIGRAPAVKLTYDCDSDRIVVHDISQYTDNVIPNRTVTLNGTPYASFSSPDTVVYIPTVGFPQGNYTVTMTMADDGCTCSDSILFVQKPQITGINNYTNFCEGTPVQLDAYVVGGVSSWLWDYGDGSYAYDGTTYHTYSCESNDHACSYAVTVTVKNSLGCTVSLSKDIFIVPQNLDGNIYMANHDPFCPGTPKEILFDQGLDHALYFWYCDGTFQHDTTDYALYSTYWTGDYKVKVEDHVTGCFLERLINVGFLTAPTAKITGNMECCLGDEVKLLGNSGAANSYIWTVSGPDNLSFSTANIKFIPSQSGTYHILLTVVSPDSCSASDSCTLTVHPLPNAPSISFCSTPCIHEPPVCVKSDDHQSLFWSNGNHGETAEFYTPGYLSAHYIDDSTGCMSAKNRLRIPPAPDYNALLTGCYKKCPEDLPFFLNLQHFYPSSGDGMQWEWYCGDALDTFGTSSSLSLPVTQYKDYHLQTSYGNGCVSASPTLSIKKTGICSCDSIRVSVKKKCLPNGCNLNYLMVVLIDNYSAVQSLTFDQISATGGAITSVTSLPVTVAPMSQQTIEVKVRLSDFANGYVEFLLKDTLHQCSKRFTDYFDWSECVNDGCQFTEEDIDFLPDLSSSHEGAFFQITLDLPTGTTHILDFWSIPSQVVTYSYNPTGQLDALLELNYGLLTQMEANGEEVCLHAIACMENAHLCHFKYCLSPAILHEMIPDYLRQLFDTITADNDTTRSFRSNSFVPQPGKPYLAPNPARDEVTVMGIAPKEVAEITILNMQGREVADIRNDYRFNVSRLATASYIVRVVTTKGDVHYLKLVKQ